jgi:hypothetical protein
MPVLQYGPSNQHRQIVEAVMMAKASNRTLVLPKLSRWSRDDVSEPLHAFSSVFDVRALSSFVPVIGHDHYQVRCDVLACRHGRTIS